MKKLLLIAVAGLFVVCSNNSFSQENEQNCFEMYKKAFEERGSYAVSDNIYRNVMIAFFEEDNNVYCVNGKVRVQDGYISSIFYYYTDGTVELYDKKFTNLKNEPPQIFGGISEMIKNADQQKLRIVFIEKLKPKRKQLKQMTIPDNL